MILPGDYISLWNETAGQGGGVVLGGGLHMELVSVSALSQGYIVEIDSSADRRVKIADPYSTKAIGTFEEYHSNLANERGRIVVAGKSYVKLRTGVTCSRGDLLYTGSVSGQAEAVTPPGDVYQQARRIGYAIASGASGAAVEAVILPRPYSADEYTDYLATFRDDFLFDRPYWYGTQAITSGIWTRTTGATGKLTCAGHTTTLTEYRRAIEGDIDHQILFLNGAIETPGWQRSGFQLTDDITGDDATLYIDWAANEVVVQATGHSDLAFSIDTSALDIWGRIVRRGNDVSFYVRYDGQQWRHIVTYSDIDLTTSITAYLLSPASEYDGAEIKEFRLFDSQYSHLIRSTGVREIPLTDASTISVDASKGNLFKVTLGGNRTLGNPTNPAPNQKIIIRVKQDGTGSRTLAYDTKYRFGSGLASPTLTTTANRTDYLGFMYNDTDDKWDFIAFINNFT